MTRPRFLADEGLRFEIVPAVRRLEPLIGIATVAERGRSDSSDADVLEFAHANSLLVARLCGGFIMATIVAASFSRPGTKLASESISARSNSPPRRP